MLWIVELQNIIMFRIFPRCLIRSVSIVAPKMVYDFNVGILYLVLCWNDYRTLCYGKMLENLLENSLVRLWNHLISFHIKVYYEPCWFRCRRQQPELYILRAPDAVAAAQPVWWPPDGAVGERHSGRLFHHGLRLPERPRPHHRAGQRPRHVPTARARVQRWEVTRRGAYGALDTIRFWLPKLVVHSYDLAGLRSNWTAANEPVRNCYEWSKFIIAMLSRPNEAPRRPLQ